MGKLERNQFRPNRVNAASLRWLLLQFEENEKKRMKAEQQRQEEKHKKQWEELVFKNETSLRELEQLQVCLWVGGEVCGVCMHFGFGWLGGGVMGA